MSLWGTDPRDTLVAALQAEIARSHEREKILLGQIADLTNKLSAHADVKAHALATRVHTPAAERKPADIRNLRLPAGVQSLAAGGHLNLFRVRRAAAQRANPNLPQAVDE